nr:Chain B, viral protein [Human alphaherpesvirus 1]
NNRDPIVISDSP